MAKESETTAAEAILFLPWGGEGSLHQRLPGCQRNSGEDQEQVSSATSAVDRAAARGESHIPTILLPLICRRIKPATLSSNSAQRVGFRLLSQLSTGLAPGTAARRAQPTANLRPPTPTDYIHRNPAAPPAIATSSTKPTAANPSSSSTKTRTPPRQSNRPPHTTAHNWDDLANSRGVLNGVLDKEAEEGSPIGPEPQ